MKTLNKDHCLACWLYVSYVEWTKLNGRATVEQRLQMAANFFAGIVEAESDLSLDALVLHDKAAKLASEAASATKH